MHHFQLHLWLEVEVLEFPKYQTEAFFLVTHVIQTAVVHRETISVLTVQARVTPGGTETFWGPQLAALDSDGDGFTNGEELQDPNGEWTEGMANPGDPALVTAPGDSNSKPTATSVTDLFGNPAIYELHNNYPNPFNPETNIQFTLPQPSNVKIDVYNIAGELITSLANNDFNIGTHSVKWNGKDNSGNSVSSGIYLYRMTANDFSESRRMLLLK